MAAGAFYRRAFHIFAILNLLRAVASLGINYGQVADNLPTPERALTLLRSLKIKKARIYDANPEILRSFAHSGVELIVTVPNELLNQLTNRGEALRWVGTNVEPYFPATNITGIAVGNEVFSGDDPVVVSDLLPAMAAVQQALADLALDRNIHVSTANSLAVLASSYPPSAATFRSNLVAVVLPLLQFLTETGAPFWVNAYPYFAYRDDPARVPLDYVLLNPNPGMVDSSTELRYDNMLYAQVDALIFAMARMGYGGLEVRVSETGWPSKGDSNEFGATVNNAGDYVRNLLRRQQLGEGTPLRPHQKLEVYLFALFNEDSKPGPTSERNYGLYRPNGTLALDIGVAAASPADSSVSLSSSSAQEATSELSSFCYWGPAFIILILEVIGIYPWD